MELEAITILVSFLAGYAIDNLWAFLQKRLLRTKDDYVKFIVRRIRIHHNLLGYILIILSLFFYPLILMPAGLGMIFGHKIRDDLFKFFEVLEKDIEKEIDVTKKDIEKGAKKIVKK